MGQHLLLSIRLHDGRYHGAPVSEWPPAPARVFQALVAGVARGRSLPEPYTAALEWLEALPPPVIAAPRQRLGSRVELFVPNNDADAVGGDPAQVSEIRTKKVVQPRLIEGDARFEYAWPVPSNDEHAPALVEAADALYQLGRGVDMAWAVAEVIDDEKLAARLAAHRGTLHRPHGRAGGNPLPCPAPGSLASLVRRHGAARLSPDGEGKAARLLFSNAPKARFVPIAYSAARQRLVYELRCRDDDGKLWPWQIARVATLVERLRDGAADRLRGALPDDTEAIERALVGRKGDGREQWPITQRVRIVPLPSIGHEHVDRAIRRVLVEVPSGCPLRADDIAWAFAGLEPADMETGVIDPVVLVRATDDRMLERYAARARRWRSITPVALPETAKRRRIEPRRQHEEAKSAAERGAEQARAIAAVHTALRHAGITASALDVRVRREPFEARGQRAEAFGAATRFPKERLWHVDVLLDEPVDGPLVLGDGRFLGLGVMTPVSDAPDIVALDVAGDAPRDMVRLCRAMRRAVMARVQAEIGSRPLDVYFSGHEDDGAPARADFSTHLAFQFDPIGRRILIIAPHVLDHRARNQTDARHLALLDRALDGMSELRVGGAGTLELSRSESDEAAAFLGPARIWESVSAYAVNRHAKASSASDALATDVLAECDRRGLPRPAVTVLDARGVPGRGLEGRLRLEFVVAIRGPLVLGRSRYLGGGLFARQDAG